MSWRHFLAQLGLREEQRLGVALFQSEALPTVEAVSVGQSVPTVDFVSQNHCVELGVVTDEEHCCVTGELNVGLGVGYHKTGLFGAETDP